MCDEMLVDDVVLKAIDRISSTHSSGGHASVSQHFNYDIMMTTLIKSKIKSSEVASETSYTAKQRSKILRIFTRGECVTVLPAVRPTLLRVAWTPPHKGVSIIKSRGKCSVLVTLSLIGRY